MTLKTRQRAWQIYLHDKSNLVLGSHLPSLAVFRSGVLTGGGRFAGDLIESPPSGRVGVVVVTPGPVGVFGPAEPGVPVGGGGVCGSAGGSD